MACVSLRPFRKVTRPSSHHGKIPLMMGVEHKQKAPLGGGTHCCDCRCFTTDSLLRGYLGQYVWASAYAELDG